MRTLALLVVLGALQQPQEKGQDPKAPKEPIRNWKYKRIDTRFDPKTKTEVEEFTVFMTGDEAVPVDFDKKIFDLRGVKANYFTTPDRDKLSKEIVVQADRGRYDHPARTLKLNDHVRVVKRNDDEKPPQVDTVLLASSALLRFNRMYECPSCRKPLASPGRCAEHGEPLKELTVTSLEVDSEFDLSGPEGLLSGEGLVTDDAINKEYHIRKNGFVEFGNDPSAFLNGRKAPVEPAAKFAQIFSRGPLQITGRE
ncbi:MAG: hypothetical protein HY293_04085, partial [Planctomycetes bacterium]|nr:hypothetical protein [Planctomycetota bacterium]